MGLELEVSASYGFFIENETLDQLFERLSIPKDSRWEYADNPGSLFYEKGFRGIELFYRHSSYTTYPGWGVAVSPSIVRFYPRSNDGMWTLETPTGPKNEKALSELDRAEDFLFPERLDGSGNTERLKRNWHLISHHF